MKNAKEDAESKAQTYIELARAILIQDRAEAKEYFNQAIEVASKIGDEVFHRWSAILDLADRAANSSQSCPKTAYKLARCAELVYDYSHDDFDWKSTVSAIAGLCPSSCFAILSRWRDRKFGRSDRLINQAISVLQDHGNIDSKLFAAFVGFRAPWQYNTLLIKSFESCDSESDQKKILNHVLQYMRLNDQSLSAWKKLKKITAENGLTVPKINRFIEHANHREAAFKYGDSSQKVSQKVEMDWDKIFLDPKSYTPNGLSSAYSKFKSSGLSFPRNVFFTELFKRIPVGKEAQLIQVFSETSEFGLYDIRHFLEELPKDWKTRMAVKSSIAKAVKRLCRRHCMEITKTNNPFYRPFPFRLASDLSNIPESDLFGIVMDAVGKTTEIVSVERLFSLVGLLAPMLSHNQARETLNFGLDLFNDALDETVGDGPWTERLVPPSDIYEAIAGYIWAALAAPQASLRWEATHVVRGLCKLSGKEVLDHLVKLAKGQSGGPFVDGKLHFYHLHARQWLMIALARAASESPDIFASHRDFFIRFALKDEPHVVIRHFAARAALTLAESESIHLDENFAARLAAVNCSKLPVESSKSYERHQDPRKESVTKNRFLFGLDVTDYWFEYLENRFAKNVPDIESEAEKVIFDDWELSESGRLNEDERKRRKIYGYRETSHSHSAYPRTDDLRFYLSYHAMMIVAGKLLVTVPLHQDPDDPEDGFKSWLDGHLLTRQDGCWLADRRDPMPLEWPKWKNEKEESEWSRSVCRSDFNSLLGLSEDRLNLFGHWNTAFGDRQEEVYIRSALVTPERAASLLRALQTATDPYNFRIPAAADGAEIDESGFQLKGWVEEDSRESKLDEFDPWAGSIRYPPLMPAKFVCDLLQLEGDRECRVWQRRTKSIPKEVIWSRVWGSYRSRDFETEGEDGRRLQASKTFLNEFLRQMNMDLIVKVEVTRSIRSNHYERSQDENTGYMPPYFRIFLIRTDGRICSLL